MGEDIVAAIAGGKGLDPLVMGHGEMRALIGESLRPAHGPRQMRVKRRGDVHILEAVAALDKPKPQVRAQGAGISTLATPSATVSISRSWFMASLHC